MNLSERTQWIKSQAYQLGFDFVGISAARKLEEDAIRLESWLNKNNQAKMSYMERHFDKRIDPRLLVPGSKSVVSLLYNYHTKANQTEGAPKLAKYAFGEDYHFVVKDKIHELMQRIQEKIGKVEGRVFVDSAPVLDRAWARESGLGWIGKNSMLINKERGSDFFISELIIDLELEYDSPIGDYCGTCTKCLDACPTDAIEEERTINSEKCISYLTIELRDNAIDQKFKDQMNDWVFGCDICQDVCPWNRFAKPHNEDRFLAKKSLLDLSREGWDQMDEPQFRELFRKSAVKRTKYSGIKRNLEFLKK
ncbi:MAG: tRNA epoxyqueuosine(34) reductase QueG [Flavobacteriales bacterium]|nr:tRNA epoxyqueuosine(34) reductase QueG [Flavobacteriales bacterium]